ncbi:hypothetical protein ACFW1M_38485 [Streptomyces inhibens]|uniref:hypothetical protein n=1 Tax=Streptomyces inhibens TaxID=2293571 RepID=UPI003678A98D
MTPPGACTTSPPAQPEATGFSLLGGPEPTGPTTAQLDTLLAALAPARAEQHEHTRHERRVGEDRWTRGAGPRRLRAHLGDRDAWRKARTKAGLSENFRFYDLRHTGNALATRSGATLTDGIAGRRRS